MGDCVSVNSWFFLVCLGLLTWLLSHAFRWLAHTYHFLDHPNDRSAHVDPTPTGGGVVILLCFTAGLAYLFLVHQEDSLPENLLIALLGPLLVAVVGLVDDLKPLSVLFRSATHLIAAAWCMAWIDFPEINLMGYTYDLGIIGLLAGILYLAGLLNLYNFMDGIDGIAAGEAVSVAGSAALIIFLNQGETNQLLILLIAVSAGFLVINWPKARLFMGDVGSGFLGMTLGLLSLQQIELSLWSWLILLAWFLTDSAITLLIRLLRGDKIHQSHNLHAYQRWSRKMGHQRTLLRILGVNLIWLFPLAFLADTYRDWGAILLVLAAMPLVLVQFLAGAGQLDK